MPVVGTAGIANTNSVIGGVDDRTYYFGAHYLRWTRRVLRRRVDGLHERVDETDAAIDGGAMKLKHRVWLLAAPKGSPSHQYSTLPLAMIERESAYLRRDQMYNALKHIEDGGPRKDNEWPIMYVQIPGLRSSVMNPNFERWESFGSGWGKFTRVDNLLPESAAKEIVRDLEDWVTLICLDPPVTVSLMDFINAKNMNAWYDLVRKKKEEAKRKQAMEG